jgi:putative membrane protein
MKVRKGIQFTLAAAYAFLWLGGMVSYSFMGGPPQHLAWTAPLYLALAGALIVAFTGHRHWAWLAVAAGIGFLSEVTGVAFGVPYGGYEYTSVLGPKFLGVPLVLTTAWLVLVAYVQHWTGALKLPKLARPVVSAIWMTVIDLLIDPLAAGPLGYWTWAEGGAYFGIPWTNFLGWFVTSLVIFVALPQSWKPHVAVRVIGASVIAFFGVIALALGFYAPGALALALVIPDAIALLRNKLKREKREVSLA